MHPRSSPADRRDREPLRTWLCRSRWQRARAFSARTPSASEWRTERDKPSRLDATVSARTARSDANAGRRRHQRPACSSFETGRAWIGNPSSQRWRSSASAGRDESPLWVLPQASQGDRLQVVRQAGDQRPRRGGLASAHQVKRLDHRRGLERRTPGQEAVQGCPEGKDVGSRTNPGAVAGNLFRGHERRGIPHSARTRCRRTGSSPTWAMPKSASIGVT